jgi:thioesterase domain-containing protein
MAFVHAVSGSAMPFQALASALGDGYACYGLQSPEQAPGQRPSSIGQLAAAHIDAIDAIRGLSPVYLAGWSMGGCVAMEMARLWQQRGVEVSSLLLLDTWPPPRTLLDAEARSRAEKALGDIDLAGLEKVGAAFDAVGDELARLRATVDANTAAYFRYEPEPLAMRVHLMRASEPNTRLRDALPEAYQSPALGWERFFESVEVHWVSGGHTTMVNGEYAARLAEVLRGAIETDDEFSEL